MNTTSPCIVTGPAAVVNGNVIRRGTGTRTLTVQNGAFVNGNLGQFGAGATVTVTGETTQINGNIYNPTQVVCTDASVNGNIDDRSSCAGVAVSCRVNGNICGSPDDSDGDDDFDDDGIDNDDDDDD